MDRLRRRLARSPGGHTYRRAEPPIASEGKQGGHGDHWGCVLRASEENDLLGFLGRVAGEVEAPEMFGGERAGVGMAACSPGDRLRACVLLIDGRLVTAYPQVLNGPVWPVTVREIVPWANGVEGQISGDCYGAAIAFFDTRFYVNRRRYRTGETYRFHMGALAYAIGPAADLEVESEIGAKVSLKGAHAYMPVSTTNEDADIDDYWFHSPLEGSKLSAGIAGHALTLYPVTMGLPEEFELRVDLFAAPHTSRPGIDTVEPGDDLDGFLWLQGYLSTEQ